MGRSGAARRRVPRLDSGQAGLNLNGSKGLKEEIRTDPVSTHRPTGLTPSRTGSIQPLVAICYRIAGHVKHAAKEGTGR